MADTRNTVLSDGSAQFFVFIQSPNLSHSASPSDITHIIHTNNLSMAFFRISTATIRTMGRLERSSQPIKATMYSAHFRDWLLAKHEAVGKPEEYGKIGKLRGLLENMGTPADLIFQDPDTVFGFLRTMTAIYDMGVFVQNAKVKYDQNDQVLSWPELPTGSASTNLQRGSEQDPLPPQIRPGHISQLFSGIAPGRHGLRQVRVVLLMDEWWHPVSGAMRLMNREREGADNPRDPVAFACTTENGTLDVLIITNDDVLSNERYRQVMRMTRLCLRKAGYEMIDDTEPSSVVIDYQKSSFVDDESIPFKDELMMLENDWTSLIKKMTPLVDESSLEDENSAPLNTSNVCSKAKQAAHSNVGPNGTAGDGAFVSTKEPGKATAGDMANSNQDSSPKK